MRNQIDKTYFLETLLEIGEIFIVHFREKTEVNEYGEIKNKYKSAKVWGSLQPESNSREAINKGAGVEELYKFYCSSEYRIYIDDIIEDENGNFLHVYEYQNWDAFGVRELKCRSIKLSENRNFEEFKKYIEEGGRMENEILHEKIKELNDKIDELKINELKALIEGKEDKLTPVEMFSLVKKVNNQIFYKSIDSELDKIRELEDKQNALEGALEQKQNKLTSEQLSVLEMNKDTIVDENKLEQAKQEINNIIENKNNESINKITRLESKVDTKQDKIDNVQLEKLKNLNYDNFATKTELGDFEERIDQDMIQKMSTVYTKYESDARYVKYTEGDAKYLSKDEANQSLALKSDIPNVEGVLDKNEADKIYLKKEDINGIDGFLSKDEANSKYATLEKIALIDEDIKNLKNNTTHNNGQPANIDHLLPREEAERTYAKRIDIPNVDNFISTSSADAKYINKSDADSKYATKSELSNYTTTNSLNEYLTKQEASTNYATKNELDGKVNENELGQKITEKLTNYETTQNANTKHQELEQKIETLTTLLAEKQNVSKALEYKTEAASNLAKTKTLLETKINNDVEQLRSEVDNTYLKKSEKVDASTLLSKNEAEGLYLKKSEKIDEASLLKKQEASTIYKTIEEYNRDKEALNEKLETLQTKEFAKQFKAENKALSDENLKQINELKLNKQDKLSQTQIDNTNLDHTQYLKQSDLASLNDEIRQLKESTTRIEERPEINLDPLNDKIRELENAGSSLDSRLVEAIRINSEQTNTLQGLVNTKQDKLNVGQLRNINEDHSLYLKQTNLDSAKTEIEQNINNKYNANKSLIDNINTQLTNKVSNELLTTNYSTTSDIEANYAKKTDIPSLDAYLESSIAESKYAKKTDLSTYTTNEALNQKEQAINAKLAEIETLKQKDVEIDGEIGNIKRDYALKTQLNDLVSESSADLKYALKTELPSLESLENKTQELETNLSTNYTNTSNLNQKIEDVKRELRAEHNNYALSSSLNDYKNKNEANSEHRELNTEISNIKRDYITNTNAEATYLKIVDKPDIAPLNQKIEALEQRPQLSDEKIKEQIERVIQENPQRFKGEQGIQGPQGLQGIPGTNGQNGQDGAVGPQGPVGPAPSEQELNAVINPRIDERLAQMSVKYWALPVAINNITFSRFGVDNAIRDNQARSMQVDGYEDEEKLRSLIGYLKYGASYEEREIFTTKLAEYVGTQRPNYASFWKLYLWKSTSQRESSSTNSPHDPIVGGVNPELDNNFWVPTNSFMNYSWKLKGDGVGIKIGMKYLIERYEWPYENNIYLRQGNAQVYSREEVDQKLNELRQELRRP